MNTRNLAAIVLLALALPAFAQTGGGTSGADFLIAPPAARVDAMGGVADPLGTGLEAMGYNPAALATQESMRLQLTIDPMPNEVTHSQLAFGFPLLGGYAAAGVQLLNTGGFTFINILGQPQDTVNVFDTAAAFSYAHYIWSTVSLGADLKGVWRSLGDENALAVAGDLGATAWFPTPHVGQAPRAPTPKQLEDEFTKAKAAIESEKQKRTATAAKQSAEAQKQLDAAEKTVTDLVKQLDAAAEDKKEAIAGKKQAAETVRDAAAAELATAQKNDAAALSEIDAWYQAEMVKAQGSYQKKVADLDTIASERKRLFTVIDDPAQELSADQLNAAIDSSIAKTRGLLEERTAAANKRKISYDERRTAQSAAASTAIAGYEALVNEAVGPRRAELVKALEALKTEQATLQQDKDANKDRLSVLSKEIDAKQKEIDGLSTDPWVKRLQERIAARQNEIKQADADTAAMAKTTEQSVAEATAAAEKDVKDFEALRVSLQKELKKTKLKRDLDKVDARSDTAQARVQAEYKAKEKALYLRLLAAMYRHEEKIFQDRLAAAQDAEAIRALDFEADQAKAAAALDDEWAFQERVLSGKIAELSAGLAKGAEEPAELKTLKADRAAKETAYRNGVAALNEKKRTFENSEKTLLEDATAAVKADQARARLIYLQTDKPYLNTAVAVGVRNVGSPVKFVSEAVPLPMSATANASYALVNVQDHNVKIAVQGDVPLLDLWSWSVGIGVEYVYAGIAYARIGYNINQLWAGLQSISGGLGVHLTAGFTTYAVDYAFKPLPDYGFQHGIGVTISF
ncbi:MAG: hypothetical protein NTU62_11860 [Spirochaetes bacterium]|nr:hypothetical protein [Spirochaetota bacterium]